MLLLAAFLHFVNQSKHYGLLLFTQISTIVPAASFVNQSE